MSDCACLWDGNDGDQPEVYSEGWVRARKTHKCTECHEVIPIGALHHRFSAKWETFKTERTCANCQNIRSSLYCEGWTFGQLWEDIEEQIFSEGGLTVACIDKLTTPEAKAFLQRRWMAYLEAL